MRLLCVCAVVLIFCAGCGSTNNKSRPNEPRNNSTNSEIEALQRGFVSQDEDPTSSRKMIVAFIDQNSDIPGDSIIKKKCRDTKTACFKNTKYSPNGFNRTVSQRPSVNNPQTITFSQDSVSLANYCFRVVMFDNVNDYKLHTKAHFGTGGKLQKPSADIWKLSGCEVQKGSPRCNFWRDRSKSPFTEMRNGQVVRKYFEELDDVIWYPKKKDVADNSQMDLYYVMEGVSKVRDQCPKARNEQDLIPQKMTGDPRMRIRR